MDKISEALECLEEIAKAPTFMGGNPKYLYHTKSEIPFMEDINTIKQALIKAEKDKRFKEIVVRKDVDILSLKISRNVKDYNIQSEFSKDKLTEEEFELLKEMIQ